MRKLWIVFKSVIWLGYLVWICLLLQSTLLDLNELDPNLPLDAAKKIALQNRFGIVIIYAVIWLGVIPIWFYADIVRLSRSNFARRITDWGRWGRTLVAPPPVTFAILAVALATLTHYRVDPVWFVPAAFALYLLVVFIRVVTGEEPRPKAPPR